MLLLAGLGEYVMFKVERNSIKKVLCIKRVLACRCLDALGKGLGGPRVLLSVTWSVLGALKFLANKN